MIADADLAGFNSNRFDIPSFSGRAYLRVGIDFDMDNRKGN